MNTRARTRINTAIDRFRLVLVLAIPLLLQTPPCRAQDYDAPEKEDAPPPEMADCNGVFMTYNFLTHEKLYPHVKNVSAQAWSFNSNAMIVNTGTEEIKGWQMFIGFQHRELIVSATGAAASDGEFPLDASNGTTFVGSENTDLKTSIDTAGDYTQISAQIEIKGTLFGVGAKATPMPKTIKLTNDGWKCPAPKRKGPRMLVCCKRDPKFKRKTKTKTKYMPRQYGDLNIAYDILQSYENNYLAQVTINNDNPIGRLDSWNLTWEWMRGEIIYKMRGAYTPIKNPADCINGRAAQYYKDLDFTNGVNCQKIPIIKDLPTERKNDNETGKLPNCCNNGTLLPNIMDPSRARSMFQLQVFKLPPDLNKTALYPPQHWKFDGYINPQYKCGAPVRVDASPFPDPTGLPGVVYAIASWQIVCNITKPKPQTTRCCVSYSAFYNESAVPCNACACGCDDIDTDTCNPKADPMLLPPEALLVPFDNRTIKAKAWARRKHRPIPKKLPCPDNCGISVNWHVNSDYKNGWTARITLFNWRNVPAIDWFVAVDLGRAGKGFENVYSFNGTRVPPKNQTLLFQGLPGMNYMIGITNGSNPLKDPEVPGKMQSVISFTKKDVHGLNIPKGDGFPKKVYFNGLECALPKHFPTKGSGERLSAIGVLPSILIVILSYLAMTDWFFFH